MIIILLKPLDEIRFVEPFILTNKLHAIVLFYYLFFVKMKIYNDQESLAHYIDS